RPEDQATGASAKHRTPRAYRADNDLAIGRVVSAISHSRFWRDTAILILEDDAQNGPDHVDAHRSVLLAVSAYNRAGVIHGFVNTTDVLATIEQLLGLSSMSQFDHYGRPLSDVFAKKADLRPYELVVPNVDLNERNPAATPAAKASAELELDEADEADDDLLNRVLWMALKGDDVQHPLLERDADFVRNPLPVEIDGDGSIAQRTHSRHRRHLFARERHDVDRLVRPRQESFVVERFLRQHDVVAAEHQPLRRLELLRGGQRRLVHQRFLHRQRVRSVREFVLREFARCRDELARLFRGRQGAS